MPILVKCPDQLLFVVCLACSRELGNNSIGETLTLGSDPALQHGLLHLHRVTSSLQNQPLSLPRLSLAFLYSKFLYCTQK